jgi:micrococcal nuclease
MRLKTKIKLFLYLLLIVIALFNYNKVDSFVTKQLDGSDYVTVSRIVDGDTFKDESGNSIRMLGINTPEKKEKYSDLGASNLERLILNQTVRLEYGKDKKDMYGRTLAYVYLDSVNVNLNQVENGYANAYFPSGHDTHYNDFMNAWKKCVDNNINFCKKSSDKCASCIELTLFDNKNEITEFTNNCDFSCSLEGWNIKDEGRKRYTFGNIILEANAKVQVIVGNKTNHDNIFYWSGEDYVWTEGGDTLFLRDKNYELVLWKSY